MRTGHFGSSYLVGKLFVDIIWPLYSLALFRKRFCPRTYIPTISYELENGSVFVFKRGEERVEFP